MAAGLVFAALAGLLIPAAKRQRAVAGQKTAPSGSELALAAGPEDG